MTNFEMYKDDLMKIKGRFAFDKAQRRVVRCNTDGLVEGCIDCKDCLFNDTQYCLESDKIEWLYKEYKPPVLSDDELELIKAFNKAMGKEYKYVARDTDGLIRFFETKPRINELKNYYNKDGYTYIGSNYGVLFLFPNITHKDGLYDIENKCFIKE